VTGRSRLTVLAGVAALIATSACSTSVVGTATPASGSVDLADGVQVFDYAAGQQHVTTTVDYTESPPVGGPHDGMWADCTGTVYDVDIRHENAVHSLEHGAVWVTYDPEALSAADVATLAELVDGVPYRMMSPYEGLGSPISVQSWNHQLTADSGDDPRLAAFADEFTVDPDSTPEVGASCENPAFLADPETA
jgi:hypothetical protein